MSEFSTESKVFLYYRCFCACTFLAFYTNYKIKFGIFLNCETHNLLKDFGKDFRLHPGFCSCTIT